ncbi:methylaspartate mutase subunit S [Halobacteria archaeon AArc-curdl1]|uniref:Methylaspartate mutase subunit S n=1 Tax=Natronosalvus hydrolyticus TaxID=2979988 RepID=A0AAP2Z6D4_9EURY|nr:methylaspartate mutase subunit S [Halobacteria archaeon AArc-curdl1]
MVVHTMSRTVVLGVIGSDAHVVGITILEQAFSAAGFTVINLGVQSSQTEFAEAAVTHDAEAVLVSSLYGHAEQDCQGFHDVLEDHGVDAVTYIGGNLSVGQGDFEQTRETFEALGFDRVFDAETGPEEAIAALKRDLHITTTEHERATVTT